MHHYFEPIVGGRPVAALIPWAKPHLQLRLAKLGPKCDTACVVYVSRGGDFMTYKGQIKYAYSVDVWDFDLVDGSCSIDRESISIRQRDGTYHKEARTRIIAPRGWAPSTVQA